MIDRPPSLEEQLACTGAAQRALHEQAALASARQFGNRVFVRAVVEISNFCRENCAYCGMRRDNRSLNRFRLDPNALAELILSHLPGSVTDLNLQAGEDPRSVTEVALPLIRRLKRETDLGISVCLGTLSSKLYDELRAAGASIYIIKFEVADPQFYCQVLAPGTLKERLDTIHLLARSGWRVSSGFICGLPGQSTRHIADNIRLAQELPLIGCSVSPFIPGDETPLAHEQGASVDLTLNAMALLRLQQPASIIPAVSALNLADTADGYRRGLRTGANLVTINMTPPDIRADYLLYKRERFIMTEERILTAIAAANLVPSRESLASHLADANPLQPVPCLSPVAAGTPS